jgi:uncharacterized membrane protein HdeD (DUF308 family)
MKHQWNARKEDKDMLLVLRNNWWALALRGVAALIFGLAAILVPDITLLGLVMLFGAYAIVDGIFAIIAAFSTSRESARWWMLPVEGVFGIAAGALAFLLPGITALVLLYLIAFWAIVTGIFEIAAAIRLRKEITGEWMMAVSGAASILFGLLLILFPGVGALAVVMWIGAYALIFGALLLALAIRLRSRKRPLVHGVPRTA